MAAIDGRYDVVVINTGFGGTKTALSFARAFKARGAGERILMLERGNVVDDAGRDRSGQGGQDL